ncbi:hypothetical protein SteCoe_12841 [Stentor coeruleus]|uniref:Uncharacterized protein n=1 Tax=Stentor coeruleus TaxID=5963 RepID=A0A1R2C9U0_9CILI|nr:hypothetical protein SteCoe_12841 [Stentor coeruleus]
MHTMKELENVSSQPLKALPKAEGLNIQQELPLFIQNLQKYITQESLKIPISLTCEKQNIEQEAHLPMLQIPSGHKGFLIKHPLKKTPDFELELSSTLVTPLCKCKYFSIKVYLKPLSSSILPVCEKVELQAFICTQDGHVITKNMKGKDILRGNYVQKMNYFLMEKVHVAYFRIQITEVSSHFIGKTVDLKIKAKTSEFMKGMGWSVKPLIIKNIVIKAKDEKKKQ